MMQITIDSLEKRYLFDAAGAALIADALTDSMEISQPIGENFIEESGRNSHQGSDWESWIDQTTDTVDFSKEFIVIDQAVEDWQQVAQYFGERYKVLVLDQTGDAFGQILNFMRDEGMNDVQSLHIISHGDQGILQLAGETFDQNGLINNQTKLGVLGQFLSEGADLHFYGCNVAQGEKGLEFLETLSSLTGADIAASDDLTGATDLGGDWTLESSIGIIETQSLEVASFSSVLMVTPDIQNFETTQILDEADLNNTPQLIDADIDLVTTNPDLDGGMLIVSSNGGGDSQLGIRNVGTGAGQIGIDGANVTYEGITIGSIVQDGQNGNNLEISFNAVSSTAGVEALIENLTYKTDSDSPPSSVEVNIFLSDGAATASSYDSVVLADNPVAYLRLDETSGTTANNLGTGSGLDSSLINGVSLNAQPLYIGAPPSAQFDGINDYIEIPNSSLINTSNVPVRTIELVFNADTVSGRQVLFEEGGGTNAFSIYIDDGNLYVQARSAGEFGPFNIMTAIEAGTTYHAAFVFDSVVTDSFTGYLDGIAFGTGTVNSDMNAHSGRIGIGAQNNANFFHDGADNAALDHFFQGRIGEVAIYNSALSATDLQDRVLAMQGDGVQVNQTITINPENDAPIVGVLSDLNVLENTPSGTVITTVSGVDPDGVDTLIYSIEGGNVDNIFAIDPTTGELRVDDATNLDFETGLTQYELLIRATENISGLQVESTLIIDVENTGGDPNVPPQLTINNGLFLQQGEEIVIQPSDLTATDPGGVSTDWFNTNFDYRQRITIDSSQILSDITDYALLIDGSNLGADFWDNVKADGSDIVISSGDGLTVLDRELVVIDVATQTLQLYARIPHLSASVDTDLYIYYGNALAAEVNSANTWQTGFTGVWHFEDNIASSDLVRDSSSESNNGFARQGLDGNNIVTGQIGNAFDFNNSEYIALDYSYNGANAVPAVSVTGWINTSFSSPGSMNGNWAILDFDRSDFFDVYIDGDGKLAFSTNGNGGIDDFTATSGPTINDGAWHHVAAVYNGVDKILYVDGVEVARDINSHSGDALGTGSTRFGFIGDGSEATTFDGGRNNLFYDGQLDNIRLFEGTLDSAWIAAEFNNSQNPSGFYSVAAQETFVKPITYTLTDIPETGTLLRSGVALGVSDTFTQAELESGLISYEHNDSFTKTDSFSFVLDDTLDSSAEFTFDITIEIEDSGQVNQDILEETFVERNTAEPRHNDTQDFAFQTNNSLSFQSGIILSTIQDFSSGGLLNFSGNVFEQYIFGDSQYETGTGVEPSKSYNPLFDSSNIVYSAMRDLDIYTLGELFKTNENLSPNDEQQTVGEDVQEEAQLQEDQQTEFFNNISPAAPTSSGFLDQLRVLQRQDQNFYRDF